MLTSHSTELNDVQLEFFGQMCYVARSLANVFSKKKIFVLFFYDLLISRHAFELNKTLIEI